MLLLFTFCDFVNSGGGALKKVNTYSEIERLLHSSLNSLKMIMKRLDNRSKILVKESQYFPWNCHGYSVDALLLMASL